MQLFCIFRYVYCGWSIRVPVVWGHCEVSVHFKYAHKLCFFQSCSMDCGMHHHHFLFCLLMFISIIVLIIQQVVAPLTKFALTLTPIAYGIEELLPPAQQNSYAISMIIRTALMILILLAALTVPYFGKHNPYFYDVMCCLLANE